MKHGELFGTLATLLLLSPVQASAEWANFGETVPIGRLETNLQKQLSSVSKNDNKRRAQLAFQIGRLHSMAYAQKSDNIPAYQSQASYSDLCDTGQFEVKSASSPGAIQTAQQHLKTAILHLREATRLDPSLLAAQLGLAWSLEQSGQKTTALKEYRRLFPIALKQEIAAGSHGPCPSIAEETGRYLKGLLPLSEKAEIASVDANLKRLQVLPRAVTPIAIPLTNEDSLTALMSEHTVRFDLDGTGSKSYSHWITPKAGWLVYDGNGSKRITSGLQLFGNVTFWIFWSNGYDALSALDDDGDGRLRGRELKGLAVWRDRNEDGVSEVNEVTALDDLGIASLGYRNLATTGDGMPYCPGGVQLSDGRSLNTYDMVLSSKGTSANSRAKQSQDECSVVRGR
jgi:hypothetical protein